MGAVTTYDPLFESAWLKWAQAIVHSQALQRDIETRAAKGDLDPVRAFRTEYHAKRHGFSIIVTDLAPIPVRWRLLMGDVANNYRAALDHLAWALVSRGRTPPGKINGEQENAVTFPIFENKVKYNKSLPRKLPGVRRADAAKVRWCQPYRNGARNRPRHPFVLLTRINNGDKHRTVQPLWAFPSRVDITVTDTQDCAVLHREHWPGPGNPLKIGTEVAFLRGRKLGDDPQLQVELDITPEPTIGGRISLKNWGNHTGIFIFGLLRQFSEQPPSIHEVGAELVRLPGS